MIDLYKMKKDELRGYLTARGVQAPKAARREELLEMAQAHSREYMLTALEEALRDARLDPKRYEPDLQPPESWTEVVTGWELNLATHDIYPAWTTRHSHGKAPFEHNHGSQDSVALYSSKTKAWEALRYRVILEAGHAVGAITRSLLIVRSEEEGRKS